MSYRYRVTKTCFWGNVHRTPSNPKHNIVTVEKKFSSKDLPSFFELIDEKKAPAKRAKKVNAPEGPDVQTGSKRGEDVVFKNKDDLEVI